MNGMGCYCPTVTKAKGQASSCRPERFLQLAAENNMVTWNITTAGELVSHDTRQVTWESRKTSNSVLAKIIVETSRGEFTHERFQAVLFIEVLDDPNASAKDVKRVVLCSGKVFYDLQDYQQKKKSNTLHWCDWATLPLPTKTIEYRAEKLQGRWTHFGCKRNAWTWATEFHAAHDAELRKIVSRKTSASPATGFNKIHKIEQEKIVTQAFWGFDARFLNIGIPDLFLQQWKHEPIHVHGKLGDTGKARQVYHWEWKIVELGLRLWGTLNR